MRLFGLRSHQSSITYILPINNNIIFSADQNGYIIKWNLSIKRPILKYKAHNDSITTLILLQNKYIISHSRDSTIKVWLDDECKFEMAVNALNFSNIILFKDEYLITPSTIDSNNLDIYKLTVKNEEWNLSRLISNFSCFQLLDKNPIESNENNLKGRQDFGIIMKIYLIESIVYIGFESGDVIGLEITIPESKIITNQNSKTIINKELKLSLIYHNSTTVPNPIISLSSLDGYLVSGSTNKKVIIHKSPPEILKFSNSGTSSILSYNNKLILGFWNGVIEYGDQIIERNLPQIRNEELTTTPSENTISDTNIKLTFMCLLRKSEDTKVDEKKSKYLTKLKRTQANDILLVGYIDGSILAYSID
ncbi:ASA1 [Candida jiufengensis]|uniref:ASA1 n=1 Tax=Candida jiufengensis TaxID=497108 RepID=UPI002225B319|nr:ASA1 [Candida jiufengensis]KAI5950260.1 ASA1 [Candida jiufengensis]